MLQCRFECVFSTTLLHGHALDMDEIALNNTNGKYLKSKDADFDASVTSVSLPAHTASWADVSLMNQPGDTTWPLVAFSYLYIRKDLSTEPGGQSSALIKAFAAMVLSPEGQALVPTFGFAPIPDTLVTSGKAALAGLTMPGAPDGDDWTFEDATESGVGMGAKVFSVKRKSYSDVQRDMVVADAAVMKAQIANLRMNEVVQLHGSGTTNPKKLFWKAMDILEVGAYTRSRQSST